MGDINWRRMARPQLDGYDTLIFLDLARERYGFVKESPGREPATFGGAVAVRAPATPYAPYLVPAPADHRNVEGAASVIERAWPEQFKQLADALGWFEPLLDTNFPDDDMMQGCTSGNSAKYGGVCITVQSPIGAAEGIVHEFGHMKLHAMGVNLMDWTNIVGNAPEELFDSPIRKDIKRPMGAVLQAQYSYIHVLHLDLALRRIGETPAMLDLNYQRMKAGKATLDEHFRPGPNGEEFMLGLNEWTLELFAEYAD